MIGNPRSFRAGWMSIDEIHTYFYQCFRELDLSHISVATLNQNPVIEARPYGGYAKEDDRTYQKELV